MTDATSAPYPLLLLVVVVAVAVDDDVPPLQSRCSPLVVDRRSRLPAPQSIPSPPLSPCC